MKKLSLFIVLFLFSIVLVYAQSDGGNVCCLKDSSGEYCSYTNADNCDNTVNSKLGVKSSVFACDQIQQCNEPTCCINAEGTCSEKVTEAQCVDQGGIATSSSECSAVPQCQIGSCVIDGQCSILTQGECTKASDEFNTVAEFSPGVTSLNECAAAISLQEGCCVTSPSCGRKTSSECVEVSGDFRPGVLCSNPDLAGVCSGFKKEDTKVCVREDLYWFDSKGNQENVVGVAYDGLIHDSVADKRGAIGNCDVAGGTICDSGSLSCVRLNCAVGDEFIARGIAQFNFEEFKTEDQRVTVTSFLLGGTSSRFNGESWCATNTNSLDTPGTSHFVVSCQEGKVAMVEECGTFREKICQSGSETNQINGESITKESATCVQNKWAQCSRCGEKGGKWWDLGRECGRNECMRLGGSSDPEISQCVYDTKNKNECWPKYSPGIDFTGGIQNGPRNSQHTVANTCGICGDGGDARLNTCDRNECTAAGDCSYNSGASWLEGAVAGGVAGFSVGLGGSALAGSEGSATFLKTTGKLVGQVLTFGQLFGGGDDHGGEGHDNSDGHHKGDNGGEGPPAPKTPNIVRFDGL